MSELCALREEVSVKRRKMTVRKLLRIRHGLRRLKRRVTVLERLLVVNVAKHRWGRR